ncbi:hypothetical protein ES703_35578 [subsurface metagenome]
MKILYAGISLISIAAVGLVFAVAMEIATHEPVYMVVMKVAAGFFGVGGPLLGWGISRRSSRKGKRRR